LTAAEIASQMGIDVTVIRLLQVFPLDEHAIFPCILPDKPVVVVEETGASAGVYETVAAMLCQRKHNAQLSWMNLGAEYVTHGSMTALYQAQELNAEAIVTKISEVVRNEN
jgi:transketolase C-terminal domain/subunit